MFFFFDSYSHSSSIRIADSSNWKINGTALPDEKTGDGGFLPYTITGTMEGAALCVFCFIGFDCLSTTINSSTIRESRIRYPISVLVSVLLLFIIFTFTSIVLTLMWPYYAQSSGAWLPLIFDDMNWEYAKWIVAIGAIICLLTSLFLFLYALMPIISSMADDGLIFSLFGTVKFTKTPIVGILTCGFIAGLLSGLFSMDQLIRMLSIGTLITFIAISSCIIIIR